MKSPAFQFYPADHLSDANIVCMTNEEYGAFMRLLCHCWLEQGLPNDDQKLAKLSMETRGWKRIRENVMALFYLDSNGLYQNQRLDEERAKQNENRDKRKDAANARWSKRNAKALHVQCKSNPDAMQMECSSSSIASSTALEKEKDKKEKPFIPSPAEDTGRLRRVSSVISEDDLSQWARESALTEWIKTAWNEIAYNLPECQSMSLEMHKGAMLIRKREAKDDDDQFGKLIRSAIIVLNSNAFCCGENDRGWKASATWLTVPKNFTKILNGDYGEFILLDDFSSAAMPEQSVPTPQRYIDPNTGEVKEYIPR